MQESLTHSYHLSVLGTFTLRSDEGLAVPINGNRVRALFVLLAIEPDVSQSQEALLSMFWPELRQKAAQDNLRRTIYRLRKAVPDAAVHLGGSGEATVPILIANHLTVRINPYAGIEVDVITFRKLLDDAKRHKHQTLQDCPQCRQQLEKAAALYRDDFLLDLDLSISNQFENWAKTLRTGLRQEVLEVLSELSQVYLNSIDLEKAEPAIRRQIEIDPLRECAYRQLMLLLAQSGRKEEALAQFDICRRNLANELGSSPSLETIALYERIHAGEWDTSLKPGVRIHEYEIKEELNRGAFGSIYRAYQPSVKREVAIKVILPRYANQPEFVRRMETEARFVARLEHPHIVPLYDYWRDVSGAYIVMRWLRCGSLESRIDQGPMEIDAILRLLDQIASALSETHKQGVVHRDLKPGNIVLDEQGNAYLTDFGIAVDLDVDEKLTAPGTLMGSPAYIAPEQLRNDPVTAQTDIYSLGIMLFEILTGTLPFGADGLAALVQQHLNEPLPSALDFRPDLPAEVDWVLRRATAKDPVSRHSDVMDLAKCFRKAVSPAWAVSSIVDNEEDPAGIKPKTSASEKAPVGHEHRQSFVGRESQLESLRSYLDDSLAGNGQLVCVSGGAGRGKTSLINEFARQAMNRHQDLLVAVGGCNVFSAAGDPYLPFRQLLAMLTADVEAQLRAGVISSDHAQRLRDRLPLTIEIIIENGHDLLDVLIPAKDLLVRAQSLHQDGSASAERLSQFIASESVSDSTMEQKRLFSQFMSVLQSICQINPLILVLDDLQWVDKASASLLYHIITHLKGQRLFIICAYRREEAALGRDGERHPMDKVLAEAKGAQGQMWINLAELEPAEEQKFVNGLLDQEPHRLTDDFRQAIFDHTAGHALFTVELLTAMKERGDLVLDEERHWIESATLDWKTLPPRIEGVIEERIGRLGPELRSLLNIASVEGELFTAEVVAGVEEKEIRHVFRSLSGELQGVHRLVSEQEEVQINQLYLTRYRFSHVLIQQYLYAQLGSGERRLLHAQVAEKLEAFVQETWRNFAAELAWHWQQAGRPDQAVQKWLWLGDRARTTYAHSEAENFYRQAVAELHEQGLIELAARTLMKLGLVYTADFQPVKAQEAYDQAFALWLPDRRMLQQEEMAFPREKLRLATEMPVSLDPGLVDDDVSTFLITQLFEGLVRVGQDQNVLPAVASRWEVLDGGTRYIFHIRDNVCWSDGNPLTASDFVFAWRRNLHADTKSLSAHLLYVLANARDYAEGIIDDAALVGVTALDDSILEITLEQPTAYLPYLMAHTVAFPIPRRIVDERGKTWAEPQHLICNGPFQIEEFDDAKLSLLRNPRYFGQFSGNVESVECLFFNEYERALQAYGRDQLDVVNLIHADPDTIALAGSLYGEELISIPRWSTFYLCFRCDKPPFDDVRVRKAFAHALDRLTLAKDGFQGLRQAAMGGFVPPGMPGHSPDIALAYNPDLGRELLAAAGFISGIHFPEIEWVSAPGGDRVISFLHTAWRNILGLDLHPKVINWEPFMEKLNSDPAQLTILGWGADIPDPENMLRTTFHSQEGINIPHWQNKQFDELTDKAERVVDHKQRMSLYKKADRILVAEETAVLPLSYALGRLLVKPWVRLPITPAISMSFRFTSVVRPS